MISEIGGKERFHGLWPAILPLRPADEPMGVQRVRAVGDAGKVEGNALRVAEPFKRCAHLLPAIIGTVGAEFRSHVIAIIDAFGGDGRIEFEGAEADLDIFGEPSRL